MLLTRVKGVLAAATLAGAFVIAGPMTAAAAGSFTCSGGSPSSPSVIPAGTYASITVTGFCVPDTGTVKVLKSLTIAPGAGFLSQDASSIVTIGGSVDVQKGGMLALGCGPIEDAACPEGADVTSNDTIHGNLGSHGAVLLIIHFDKIDGNVGVEGGGGGLSCDSCPFIDFDHNSIGRNASVTGIQTCWSGFSNNKVGGNVAYTNNQTVLPDGNFVGGNTIARNLSCSGDSPTPHLSDGFAVPNSVTGHTSGQCAAEI